MDRVLVSGAAGFIGFHLSKALLDLGYAVTGLDNMNAYYDVELKESRLKLLREREGFRFIQGDLEDRTLMRQCLKDGGFSTVAHLAAQAGVRYSVEHPEAYIGANMHGFFNILDASKEYEVPHFLYASSSSVYGANEEMPFRETDVTDRPVSLYAATKKSNELMAYAYSHMFGLKTTGVRFFTVYGPYGRPDMAPMIFARQMLNGETIRVNNYGDMQRDFTYVDDVVKGVIALMDRSGALHAPDVPCRIYNLGNSSPVPLMDFVREMERALGVSAKIEYGPLPKGDVPATYADTTRIFEDTGFCPGTPLGEGIAAFARWYRAFYGV